MFNLGEPQFYLVEPRRIRGSEAHLNVGVLGPEFTGSLSLARAEIIGNDVDLFASRLVGHAVAQESHKRDQALSFAAC